jgi:hypothetical protein
VKRLALFFAIAWWTQGALCVLPLGFSHAHASEPAASRHDHHASAPAPEPARGHHSQEDPSCAEHCASLSRALASQAPQPEPRGSEFALLPLDLVPAAVLPLLAPGSAVARGQPPPGLARANPILRI